MRYLIINNGYESCCGFSICVNGVTEKYKKYGENTKLCADLFIFVRGCSYHERKDKIIERCGDLFDFMVLCEDGKIEVLKDDVK